MTELISGMAASLHQCTGFPLGILAFDTSIAQSNHGLADG
ncbi:MAG: hypothetical protein CM15mP120_27550 [Pseudomonadota bacterium]|nr:MAG: hypothetical protein CM15mP120_27550 [Pseudomonadota bacterium]